MSALVERSAAGGVALGAILVAFGGLLLGLQVDAGGHLCGTGLAALGIGFLLSLAALVARARGRFALPRDEVGIAAVVATFAGLAFAVSGVLAPGGPWMFLELVLLLAVVAWRRADPESGRWLSNGALGLLAAFLVFRLWISWQGSQFRWQVMSIDVPILSWIPLEVLDPVKRVALGSFTPHELGFPPTGLDFALSCTLWSLGFAACVAGLVLVQASAREHENDRVHALIRTLPPDVANLVERIVPEREWHALGLHGLPERELARAIESRVAERIRGQRAIQSSIDTLKLLQARNTSGFGRDIERALRESDERGGASA